MAPNHNQIALDEHGNLKDEKDIPWSYSETDESPIKASNKGIYFNFAVEIQEFWINHHSTQLLPLIALLDLTGSAVAVERIFSGGRDTILLRRASLQPDTVRMLMLVKHRLRLKQNANVIVINWLVWSN